MKKKIVFGSYAFMAVGLTWVFWTSHQINKQIAESRRKMAQPLPKIGEDYLKDLKLSLDSPETQAAHKVIDDYIKENFPDLK